METIVGLTDARDGFGGKAANLAALLTGGFDVPDGFAIAPDAPLDGLRARIDALGDVAVAVRSSALDEDGADASFAGIYDSVVDVRGAAAVEDAIAQVRQSALSPRALAYRRDGTPVRMGVVVQRLVHADCAGVMFTADPVTGDRDVTVVTAIPGLGEALVSGDRGGEEWVVRGGKPVRRRALPRSVLTDQQVRELVAIGERVAAYFEGPQDIEWVIEGGRISLVQARPITALPDSVEWKPPHPKGTYVRNFRWGEWLSDPVSPLFATWFLQRASDKFDEINADTWGMRIPPPSWGIVNGWYYFSPFGSGGPAVILGGLLRRPGLLVRMLRASADPGGVGSKTVEPFVKQFEEDIAPRYRAFAAEQLGETVQSLVDYIDRAAELQAEMMFSITLVGGFAWKVESALAKFFRANCAGVDGAPHELVSALSPVEPCAAHHACSLDWLHPTAGELGLAGTKTPVRGDGAARRAELERACLDSLQPKQRAQFETLLAVAQRFARLREAQAHELTLPWPNLRAAVLKLDGMAHAAGSTAEIGDVFWLNRDELEDAIAGRRRFQREVAERRATWERQRKLAPPLILGEISAVFRPHFVDLPRHLRGGDVEASETTIVGMPASAGRATGRVRLVQSPADFDRLQDGEILVAPTTAPAWTPLFARAVAVVTDGGSVAAHASLVAREYGIPAVVGTFDATRRLHDGQLVTVDGTTGRVDILGSDEA